GPVAFAVPHPPAHPADLDDRAPRLRSPSPRRTDAARLDRAPLDLVAYPSSAKHQLGLRLGNQTPENHAASAVSRAANDPHPAGGLPSNALDPHQMLRTLLSRMSLLRQRQLAPMFPRPGFIRL